MGASISPEMLLATPFILGVPLASSLLAISKTMYRVQKPSAELSFPPGDRLVPGSLPEAQFPRNPTFSPDLAPSRGHFFSVRGKLPCPSYF